MTEAKFKNKQGGEKPCHSQYIEYRYRAPKNSSASAIWLAAENVQKNHLFLFSKLAKVWLKDGRGMGNQEERMKNKKYRSLKMFPSDIILKFKNIVKFN